MTTKAERSDVVEIALATTLGHRKNMIGIPKTLAHSFSKAPVLHKGHTAFAARSLQLAMFPDRIQSTVGAHASIALENLFAQVTRLRPQLPLVYTKIGAEGEAASRHLKRTPAAQAAPIGTARNILTVDPSSTRQNSRSAHTLVLNSPAASA
jgi:hypothetical protein